jgi:hypothetical protein
MAEIVRFAATAHLSAPIAGRHVIVTAAQDATFLLARSPAAAARIWYWRLAQAERSVCDKIVVSAWDHAAFGSVPSYKGPSIAYAPREGWRVVEAADAAPSKRPSKVRGA